MIQQVGAFLITVTGPDHPGITASLVGILASHSVVILDIEQITNAGNLNLSLRVQLGQGSGDGPVFKDLLFAGWELGVKINFRPLAELPEPTLDSRSYALTLMGAPVDARSIAGVAQVLAGSDINIDRISRLSEEGELSCLEMILSATREMSVTEVKQLLLPVSQDTGIDLAIQRESLVRRVKRLVVFDMDSTLVQGEIIDELARARGVFEDVSHITERAMQGELDFSESLRERVALLKGTPVKVLGEVHGRVKLSPGAGDLVKVLKRLGYRLAVISGGFTFFTDRMKQELGLDYAYANQLEVRDGHLTGGLVGGIVDGQRKADLLVTLAQSEGIGLDQVIAIGDGANDIAMLELAGLGIAFNAKVKVRERADHAINRPRLDSILFLLGISSREQSILLESP